MIRVGGWISLTSTNDLRRCAGFQTTSCLVSFGWLTADETGQLLINFGLLMLWPGLEIRVNDPPVDRPHEARPLFRCSNMP